MSSPLDRRDVDACTGCLWHVIKCTTLLHIRHIFAIGSAAYERLTSRDGEPQVVIISGESGSGKTEATKLIMQYLAAVNKAIPPASSLVTEQILEASPLLESFGNATTVRNDNSSRFGKYTQIFFRKLVLHYLFVIINEQICNRIRVGGEGEGEGKPQKNWIISEGYNVIHFSVINWSKSFFKEDYLTY